MKIIGLAAAICFLVGGLSSSHATGQLAKVGYYKSAKLAAFNMAKNKFIRGYTSPRAGSEKFKALWNKLPKKMFRVLKATGAPKFSKTGISQRWTISTRKSVGGKPAAQVQISVRKMYKKGEFLGYKAYAGGDPMKTVKFAKPVKAPKKVGGGYHFGGGYEGGGNFHQGGGYE